MSTLEDGIVSCWAHLTEVLQANQPGFEILFYFFFTFFVVVVEPFQQILERLSPFLEAVFLSVNYTRVGSVITRATLTL